MGLEGIREGKPHSGMNAAMSILYSKRIKLQSFLSFQGQEPWDPMARGRKWLSPEDLLLMTSDFLLPELWAVSVCCIKCPPTVQCCYGGPGRLRQWLSSLLPKLLKRDPVIVCCITLLVNNRHRHTCAPSTTCSYCSLECPVAFHLLVLMSMALTLGLHSGAARILHPGCPVISLKDTGKWWCYAFR